MTVTHDTKPAIPIVDIAAASSGTPEEHSKIAQELVLACQRVGFVCITGHGISTATIEEAFAVSKTLFSLPYSDKMKAPHPPGGAVHRGYSYPGQEKVSQATSDDEVEALRQIKDCKESYEIGSDLDPEQPNVWLPETILPNFRAFTTTLYWTLFSAGREILRLISHGIGLTDEDYLLKFHSGHGNQLRLLHYPPIPAGEVEQNLATRMPAHTDWGSITLLFQDDCGGLEVENLNSPGSFIPVEPVKDALIINVGDLLMRWSNGAFALLSTPLSDLLTPNPPYPMPVLIKSPLLFCADTLRSTSHRVSLPPLSTRFSGSDRLTRERYSIVYFIAPTADSMITCLENCANKANPPRYEPIKWGDYRLMRASTQY